MTPFSFATASAIASMRALTMSNSTRVAISGTITSGTTGLPVLLAGLDRRLENGARLHLGDFRIGDGDAAAAEAEHRIELGKLGRAMLDLLRLGAKRLRDFGNLGLAMRQEFMQRRVEQTDGDRQPLHDLEQLGEVAALHRQDLGERRAARLLRIGEDHLAHREDAVGIEEHVFGAAQSDALGAELQSGARIRRRVGIGAHAELAHLVGPGHQRAELARQFRLDHLAPGRAAPDRSSRRS